ncbi:MAG: oxygenase MpaB family protein [Jatrophihabitans sp.]
MTPPGLTLVRDRLGSALFERVAGAQGPDRRQRLQHADGARWFAEDRPIRRVHGDAAMFVGGLRALLLQSLHPLAMAGVAGHSGYRGDPWGRLQRTSYFLAVTSFGTTEDAEAMIARVRAIHDKVTGVAPDGRSYAASDPHLLRWVHLAEVDSFLHTHQRYGAQPLDQADRDGYVADTALVARALGVLDPPTTEAGLQAELNDFRGELVGTSQAREAARFMLLQPPLPLAVRPPYALLAAAAVASLPRWARWPLRLPYLPVAEATVVRLAGAGLVRTIRWAMKPPA